MKLFKNCLFLSALALYPLSAQAAASSGNEETAASEIWYAKALTPIEPSHQVLVDQARTNSEARQELLDRIQSGTISLEFFKTFDLTFLFADLDLAKMTDGEMHAIARTMNPLPKGYRDIVEAKANEGNAVAQSTFGYLFLLENDYDKAAYWLRLAAAQDNAVSLYNLAVNFSRGIKPLEHENELEMLKKSADLGFVAALLCICEDDPHFKEHVVRTAHFRIALAESILATLLQKDKRYDDALVFTERACAQINDEKSCALRDNRRLSRAFDHLELKQYEKFNESIQIYLKDAAHSHLDENFEPFYILLSEKYKKLSDQIELQNLEVALRKCEKGPDESLYHEKKGLEKFFRVFKQYLTNYYRENNIDEHANYLNEGEDGDDSDY